MIRCESVHATPAGRVVYLDCSKLQIEGLTGNQISR